MEWLWILMGAVILLLALACVAGTLACLRMVVKAPRRDEEYMKGQESRNGFGDVVDAWEREWQRIPFTLESRGVTLSGEYRLNPADTGGRRKVAIVCHGHTANRVNALKYADVFYRCGYSTVLYDQRYFGRSTGDRCTLGQEEVHDLVNVIAWAREVFGRDCVIALQGESMGAATVLLSLALTNPDFVVVDCPFADSMLLFRHVLEDNMHLPAFPVLTLVNPLGGALYGYHPKDVSPMAAVAGARVPICFMHGAADNLIPCSHSEMMYQKCLDPRCELHLFDGSDHACSFYEHRSEYDALMSAFIRANTPADAPVSV